MNIKITEDFIDDAVDTWVKTPNCDITLRQWFWWMSDKAYDKYVIRGEYE